MQWAVTEHWASARDTEHLLFDLILTPPYDVDIIIHI